MLAYGLHLGARLPAHATSTGRVLLAAKTRADFGAWLKGRELQRLTVHTVVEPRRFRSLIEQVRSRDFCFEAEEHELGVQAMAVPLRTSGRARAAATAPHHRGHVLARAAAAKARTGVRIVDLTSVSVTR